MERILGHYIRTERKRTAPSLYSLDEVLDGTPGPRIDHPWQLGGLAEELDRFIDTSDAAICACEICDELPWLAGSIDALRSRQKLFVEQVRDIAEEGGECTNLAGFHRLIERAREIAEEVRLLQVKKEDRIWKVRGVDLGGSD